MAKNRVAKKDSIVSSESSRDDIPQKGSKRALYIRRALEDREEKKKLSSVCGEDYWSDV